MNRMGSMSLRIVDINHIMSLGYNVVELLEAEHIFFRKCISPLDTATFPDSNLTGNTL
ncbi:hypothetical protein D3C73_1039720 [compost metagenome]